MTTQLAVAADRDAALAMLTGPGGEFEIVTSEVLGQPMSVFAHRLHNVPELLDASEAHGDAIYLVDGDRRISFTEHLVTVRAFATVLQERHGVRQGDRVALLGLNCSEWVISFWAIELLGAVAVGLNSWWAEPEIRYGLADCDPALLIADARLRDRLGPPPVPTLAMEDVHDLAAAAAGRVPVPRPEIDEDDPAIVLYTSGTTGRPKGAVHSHRNMLCANDFHLLNDAVAATLGNPASGRRFLLATPLFHIAPLHNLILPRIAVGDTAVIYRGRFDIDTVLRLIETEGITNWGAVPTMAARIVQLGDLSGYDVSTLRTMSLGSAPAAPGLRSRLIAALPQVRRSLGVTYGSTETTTAVTLGSAAEIDAMPLTSGRVVPTMQLQVRDAQGAVVPDGVDGDIWVRGPQVMLGYWRDEAATAAAFDDDRWFRTGDLGQLEGGHLFVASRRSDLILRSGENIYPAEVEAALGEHDAVLECLVYGVDDADLGQSVAAVVVVGGRYADVSPDEVRDDLVAFLSGRLARIKLPEQWRITTEPLPRNATGKVNRREAVG